MDRKLSSYLKLSVFNFILVAVLGTLMRYKIAFSFPFLEQKYLQESHSHFAFYGWITSCLYILIVKYLMDENPSAPLRKYESLILINFVASYGLMFAFMYGGYYWLSIACSTLALLVSFTFFFFLLKDFKQVKDHSKIWFLAGLFFAMLSSVGVFGLSYMMVTNFISQNLYLAASYYYLHYQYNGFFIFSCIGLLFHNLKHIGVEISDRENKSIFYLLFVGCVVGYGLSVLCADLPFWVFILIAVGTIMQTIGAIKLYLLVKNNWTKLKETRTGLQRFIVIYVGFAFAVKIALQLGSNIPAVNQFAFGFRNIVIAYLHLVLLMCVAVFLISQLLLIQKFQFNKALANGIRLLLLGVFLNEAVLGIMGIFSIKYIAVPYANEILFAVSALILISLFMIFANLKRIKT